MANAFTRGTTPDFSFQVNQDVSDWDIYLSFGQEGKTLATVRNPTVTPSNEGCIISGRLTQEQTLKFREGKGTAQLRCYKNGAAGATGMDFEFDVRPILMDGRIPR